MYSRHLFPYGRLNWQQKTLLQRELNGDVARFTTHTKTVLPTNQFVHSFERGW